MTVMMIMAKLSALFLTANSFPGFPRVAAMDIFLVLLGLISMV